MDQIQTQNSGKYYQGRRHFSIKMREPYYLPQEKIELPAPEQAPAKPSPINLWISLLPPLLALVGAVVSQLFSQQKNFGLVIPIVVMSLGFPLANYVSVKAQQKAYIQKLEERGKKYQQDLAEIQRHLEELTAQQRNALNNEYPPIAGVVQIALSRGKNERLWWRRSEDFDFLSLRIGKGTIKSTFEVTPPRFSDAADPLVKSIAPLINGYKSITDAPMLVDLKRAGSLVISGKETAKTYALAFRILVDILTHHSPENVTLMLSADGVSVARNWEWLKWAPHAKILTPSSREQNIAYTSNDNKTLLKALFDEYRIRKNKIRDYQPTSMQFLPALIVILDDTGGIRQSPEISALASDGYQVGIYLIFIGSMNAPNTCRTRIEILENDQFKYQETRAVDVSPVTLTGASEFLSMDVCDKVSRSLAALEVTGSKRSFALPDSVNVSQILGDESLQSDVIKERWSNTLPDREQALFPVGLFVSREGPEVLNLDFRPDDAGGGMDFNAFLIGAPGSGKSVFLQSMVLATAYKYSPKNINFMMIDFKPGPSELSKLSQLPHVVGFLDEFSGEGGLKAERALQALENEFAKRDRLFIEAGNISAGGRPKDIYVYNQRFRDRPLPHLLVIIDEFEAGVKMIPTLLDRLQPIGSKGRAYGIYFILANQRTIHQMEMLSDFVAWKILLKVQNPAEMALIDRNLPIPPGKGRGYLRVKESIIEFQGAYAGGHYSPGNQIDNQEYTIDLIEPDGRLKTFCKHMPEIQPGDPAQSSTELGFIIDLIQRAGKDLGIPQATPIYLEPIPPILDLVDLNDKVKSYRHCTAEGWSEVICPEKKFVANIGMLEFPQDCFQKPFEIDFKQKDGHLWVIGSPGSGKSQTLGSLILSLASAHRPDEIQFYILEFGAGELMPFSALPHTGAVIRIGEAERVERLIKFLSHEIEKRTSLTQTPDRIPPELFLVINNFADFRSTYPELAEEIGHFVRTGKGAGIHIIIATNRGSELLRNISSNIANRLILNLATMDEYQDVLGLRPFTRSMNCIGRGFWQENRLAECQIASFRFRDTPVAASRGCWSGDIPQTIEALSDAYPISEIIKRTAGLESKSDQLNIPVGISYENVDLIKENLILEMPAWLVLGPRQSGKSNLLAAFGIGAGILNPDRLNVLAFPLRRGPLFAQKDNSIQVIQSIEEMTEECKKIIAGANAGQKPILLLIDDLGAAFEPGKESLVQQLNLLAQRINSLNQVYLIASGMREELQLGNQIIKLLKQSRTGVSFSKDPSDLDWLGTVLTPQLRKPTLNPGRGYLVLKGISSLFQAFQVE